METLRSNIDDCINKAILALAFLRQRLVEHQDPDAVSAAQLRLRAITNSLIKMSGVAADDTCVDLPEDLEIGAIDTDEPAPPEDIKALYNVWVEVERVDCVSDHYESGFIEPKKIGSFTTLRSALEQVLSLQGVYGGIQLFQHDYDELEQAEETEKLLADGPAEQAEEKPVEPIEQPACDPTCFEPDEDGICLACDEICESECCGQIPIVEDEQTEEHEQDND